MQGGDEHAQIGGHRLLPGDHLERAVLEVFAQGVDLASASMTRSARTRSASSRAPVACSMATADQLGHLDDAGPDLVEFVVEDVTHAWTIRPFERRCSAQDVNDPGPEGEQRVSRRRRADAAQPPVHRCIVGPRDASRCVLRSVALGSYSPPPATGRAVAPRRPAGLPAATRLALPSSSSRRSTTAWSSSTATSGPCSSTRPPGRWASSTSTRWPSPALVSIARKALETGEHLTVAVDLPIDRLGREPIALAVTAVPLPGRDERTRGGVPAARRRQRAAPARGGPPRLRGQRLARAEDAGRRAHPAGRGDPGRRRRARDGGPLRRRASSTRAPGWPGWSAS